MKGAFVLNKERLDNSVLDNAISTYKTVVEVAGDIIDEDYSPVLDKVMLAFLEELKQYRDLEEQGLLLRLPCKVGDKVYVKLASYCEEKYAEAEVRDFTHFTSCGFCIVVTSKSFDKQNIPFTEFGKTVFLTQSEAEEKLRELEGE